MEKIFVVVKTGGDYDAYFHTNYAAFFKRPDAKQYIKNQIYFKQKTYKEHIILADFATEYYKLNHFPRSPQRLEFPRWPKGLAESYITKEMRKERDDILKKNQENSKAHNVEVAAFTAKMLKAQQAFAEEKGFVIPEYVVNYAQAPDRDDEWVIEELEIK